MTHDPDSLDPEIRQALSALDPDPSEIPDPAAAYRRYRELEAGGKSAAELSGVHGPTARGHAAAGPIRVFLLQTHRRSMAVAAAIVVCLVTGITYAPARQILADFLSIFRVREFSAFPVDRDQMKKLQDLQHAVQEQLLPDQSFERKPGTPRKVADLEEASSVAGFRVQVPADLPAGAIRESLVVAVGPAVRVTVDRDRMQGLLDSAGLGGITIPPVGNGEFRVDVPAIVCQTYRVDSAQQGGSEAGKEESKDGGKEGSSQGSAETHDPSGKTGERIPMIRIFQVAEPAVTLPPGADATALGRTFLQILGLPEAEAERMAQDTDWTSTLVLPIPKDMASYRAVTIHGAKGLSLEQIPGSRPYRRGSALLWQSGGVVYSVQGEYVAPSELMRVAQSLH